MSADPRLRHFLDDQDRLVAWPRRDPLRVAALHYLLTKVDLERDYREADLNALLRRWHLFNDPALLRREMFDRGLVGRTRDGHRYWRIAVGVVRFY